MNCRPDVGGDGLVQWLATLLALFLSLGSSAGWSYSRSTVEFLEFGSSAAILSGSLPRGDDVNSDPIPIPNGFPFSNETESVVFVNVNGFLSFRTARDYASPEEEFSSSSDYTHILAPYWADYDITQQGCRL
ncbi:hypothetical protein GBAR_LOCUS10528 [Geodia barretti]|nr:hypothetical protein GBAR_LOCUS10528 [Geodia barretti]